MTVSDVYARVCDRLLEHGGFVLGRVTEDDFLKAFADVVIDFCARTGFSKLIYTQKITATHAQYAIPDNQIRVEHLYVGGKALPRTTRMELDDSAFNWQNQPPNTPRLFHEDGLPEATVELYPTPAVTGASSGYPKTGGFFPADNNLTTIGTQVPSAASYALGSAIPLVPATFVPYLAWGVLQKILSMDGEMRDAQRAAYAEARYEEGVNLLQAILREKLGDEPEEAS